MLQSERSAKWALLFGNFVIGTGVLAPAGLINELSAVFAVDVATVGLLIAYGAAVLCIEAPLLAFLTNRIDRRALLTGSLALYAAGHLASAFASDFSQLLAARLIMIGAAAVFTPQAASALGLFVPPQKRAGAVAFIFLGWSLASAVGIPIATLLGSHWGWASVYFLLALACALTALLVCVTLPRGLRTPPLSLDAWRRVLARGNILLLLVVTSIFIAGQFTEYPYIAATLKNELDAAPQLIAILLAVYGASGVLGSLTTASAIDRFGAPATATVALTIVIVGLAIWSLSGPSPVFATLGLVLWGLGGGPAIAAQQARFIAADPDVASASVALNTSVLYLGQAAGTAIGGGLLSAGRPQLMGVVGVALIVVALFASVAAKARYRA